ncbi:MAG: PAS domain S-box protein [Burkholderiaceae bacterium]
METLLDDTFNHANVGIAHVAPDGRWLRVNDSLCQLMHLSRARLLQTRFQEITHRDDLDSDLVLLGQLIAGEIDSYRIEKRFYRGDGRLIWVDLQVGAQRDEQGGLRYCISTLLDITARKQAEALATEMRQRLAYALDAGGLGEWSLDLRSGEAERSRRHDEIFGYVDSPPDWNYNIFLRHVYPDDRTRVHQALRQSMATGNEWAFDVRILRRDGVLRWIWACGRVTLVEHGQPVRLSGVVQDITRRKRYEQGNRLLAEIAAPLASLDDDPHRLQSVVLLAAPDLADRCAIELLQADGGIHRVADSIHGSGPVPPASSPLVGTDVIGQRLSLA